MRLLSRALLAASLALGGLAVAPPAAASGPAVAVQVGGLCYYAQRGATTELEVVVVESADGGVHGVTIEATLPDGITATIPGEPRAVHGAAAFRVTLAVAADVPIGPATIGFEAMAGGESLAVATYPLQVVDSPGAPTGVVATPGDRTATVTWVPGDIGHRFGGSLLATRLYQVVASPGGARAVVNALDGTVTVGGLDNGTAYTFTVVAWNSWGETASAPSAPVTPMPVPRAPTGVTATGTGTSRTVSWTPPAEQAAAVTGWVVTSYPFRITATAGPGETSAVVGGLDPYETFEFSVHATSASGDGHPGWTDPAGRPVTFGGTLTAEDEAESVRVQDATPGVVAWEVQTFPDTDGFYDLITDADGDFAVPLDALGGSTASARVRAVTEGGRGPWSSPSAPVAIGPDGPGTPTVMMEPWAVAGDGQAWVCFLGVRDGGSPVTGYVVVSDSGHAAYLPAAARSGWIGLPNFVQHRLRVYALTEAFPDVPDHGGGNDVVVEPGRTPGAVSDVAATPGDGTATVSWLVADPTPDDTYEVVASPGGATAVTNGLDRSAVLTGLDNGTAYTFTVRALNRFGETAASAEPVTPFGPPYSVGDLTAAPSADTPGVAVVSWDAPGANGSPVTKYVVTTSPTNALIETTATSVTLPVGYGTFEFSVVPVNAAGPGAAASTPPLTLEPWPGAPEPVTGLAAVADPDDATRALVSWEAAFPNGSPVTTYAVTVLPGGAVTETTGTSVSLPLGYGTYTIQVRAFNGAGMSEVASAELTLAPPPGAPAAPPWADAVAHPSVKGAVLVTWGAAPDALTYVVTVLPGGATYSASGTSLGISLPDGTYRVTVAGVNDTGLGPATESGPALVDTTAPVVTMGALPALGFASEQHVRYAGTGAATYDVRYRRARYSGGFGALTYPAEWQGTAQASVALDTFAGYTYCFSVRARDASGNVSDWSAERCTAAALDDHSLSASPSWSRGYSGRYYFGTYRVTTRAGATLSRTGVVARRFALVATRCSTCGVVGVYLNGVLLKRISLRATTTLYQRVFAIDLGSLRSGTVTVKALSGKAYVDGLAISRM